MSADSGWTKRLVRRSAPRTGLAQSSRGRPQARTSAPRKDCGRSSRAGDCDQMMLPSTIVAEVGILARNLSRNLTRRPL